jgi:parallel beta-helix repeat protein
MRRTVAAFTVALILVGTFTVAVHIRPVIGNGTIYIRADGSIEPSTANITTADNVTYTFTDNNYDEIAVQRSNIIIDGNGFTLQGSGNGNGFGLYSLNNVTIRRTNIYGFQDAISTSMSSRNAFYGNTMTGNAGHVIELSSSFNNLIVENNLTGNSGHCIVLFGSSNNSVVGNNVVGNGVGHGVMLYDSSNNNLVKENNFENTGDGVVLHNGSNNNTVVGNSIVGSHAWGIWLDCASNTIYHNNFIDNADQVHCPSTNIWDNGYPSGGNYWSDYTDVDSYKGQYQNETGSDGVWDHPYVVDEDNQDKYPLTKPYGGPAGDVDGDSDVDIYDIVQMATIYGVEYPDQRYDRLCDMDLDGDIDIFDVVIAAGNYGKNWHAPEPTYDELKLPKTRVLGNIAFDFYANWTANEGSMDYYVFGTNNTGVWVNTTYSFSGGTWSNQTRTLNATAKIVTYEIWANQTSGSWSSTGVRYVYLAWDRNMSTQWIFDHVVARKVNSSFPLVKGWDERNGVTTNIANAELLVGVLAYNYEPNATYLNGAEEYASWLAGQPICRLFQSHNLTSNSWINGAELQTSAQYLTLLAQLALYNATYKALLESAIQNFTDIFVNPITHLTYNTRNVDGTYWSPVGYDRCATQTHVYAVAAITFSGYVLNNNMLKNMGIDMLLNLTLSGINIPYYNYNVATAEGMPEINPFSKEDAVFGMHLLAASTVYAFTENNTVKDRIKTVADSAIKHLWTETVDGNHEWIYYVNPDTGAKSANLSVHGFGALDEAMLHAYLIWDNQTYLDYARTDYLTLAYDGHILINDLICHAVRWNNTDYYIDATYHYDSDMYWNTPSVRAGYIFYAINATRLYHNATFLDTYEKLYLAQNAYQKREYGLVQGVLASNFTLVPTDYGNYFSRYDNPASLALILRCFAPSDIETITVNEINDIYKSIGSPLTGARISLEP